MKTGTVPACAAALRVFSAAQVCVTVVVLLSLSLPRMSEAQQRAEKVP
ncbi:MAG TPA: hypothetical protein VLD59_11200 [Steroidobacteraceae bacterium]|jgi:hypothetical protein|nr:hypothetical protein [Steroidobacteraceae bacterium]